MNPKVSVLIATTYNYLFFLSNAEKHNTKLTFPYLFIINNRKVLVTKDSVAMYFIKDHTNNVVYAWKHGTSLSVNTLQANKAFDQLISNIFNKSYQLPTINNHLN